MLIDKQIFECRQEIERLEKKIKELLAMKLKKQSAGFEVGSVVYYPAPPLMNVVPCRLEIEETPDGKVLFYARPIRYDKKTKKELPSKRHYKLGTDLSKCGDLQKEPPKAKIKIKREKSVDELEDAVVVYPAFLYDRPKKKLVLKKKEGKSLK